MRKRIFEIIEVADSKHTLSSVYDVFMIIVIVCSIIPIITRGAGTFSLVMDYATAGIFIIDYLLRLITADYKLKKGKQSFFLYPFTPMAIIDLLSILAVSRTLRIFKLLRLLKVFRVFRVFRYSKNITIILNVFKKQKKSLLVVCTLGIGFIVVSALVVFCVEPDTFPTFFDALYWATVSLTTVGYGDIYPVSVAGKIVTMCSTIFGIAIVALPPGIVTAGYLDEVYKSKQEQKELPADEEKKD